MRVALLLGTFSSFLSRKAMTSEVVMVDKMMGSDFRPVSSTTLRLRPKPSSTTAACSSFLEVKLTPGCRRVLSLRNRVSSMPARMANTGPPTTGIHFPSSHAGTARRRHSRIPRTFCLTTFMFSTPFCMMRPPV